MNKTLDNTQVQSIFSEAINKLTSERVSDKRDLALVILEYFRKYSESGNDIPGFRGQGLKEMISFSETIISGDFANAKINTFFLAKVFQ